MLNTNIKGLKSTNDKNALKGAKTATNLKSNFFNKNQKHLYI